MSNTKKILLCTQILLSAGLLAWVFRSVAWDGLVSTLVQTRPLPLLLAFALMQFNVALQGGRLFVLLKSTGGPWRFAETVTAYSLGLFHDMYLPANIGGDAYRTLRLGAGGHLTTVASAIFALRVQGAFGLMLLGAMGAGGHFFSLPGFLAALLFSIGAVGLLLLARQHLQQGKAAHPDSLRTQSKIMRFLRAMTLFAGNCRVFITSQIIHLIFVVTTCAIYGLVFYGLGIRLSWANLSVGVPVIMFASMLPISIQGRGITEWLACLFWLGSGASREQLVMGCLAVYFLLLIQGLFYGSIWVLTGGARTLRTRSENNRKVTSS